MTGKNPGSTAIYGFTDVKPGTLTLFFPNFGERARRHALGRRGPRRQALDRHEHSRHVSGAPAERPPRVRLRRAQPRARRASAGPAAATQDGAATRSTSTTRTPTSVPTRSSPTRAPCSKRAAACTWISCENEAWDLFIGVVTECDRLHHYFWSEYADPAAPHHRKFLDVYRQLDDVLGDLVAAIPDGRAALRRGRPRPHAHPPRVLPERVAPAAGAPRASPSRSRRARRTSIRRSKVFVLDPGSRLRAPARTLPARHRRRRTRRTALLARVTRGVARRCATTAPARPAGGRPVQRVFTRDELYHGAARSTPRPTS